MRNGKPLYRAAVANKACGTICWPNLPDALRVADVEADGQPDVLLNLYTGGAHCCNVTDLFRYDRARDDYSSLLHVWGDPGYSLERLDASKEYEFVTDDERFAYEFAAFAFSGLPLQILRLEDGRFVAVTRAYPKLVAPAAAQQWRYYLDNRSDGTGLGFLAAWAADEYVLGRHDQVAQKLTQLERARDGPRDCRARPEAASDRPATSWVARRRPAPDSSRGSTASCERPGTRADGTDRPAIAFAPLRWCAAGGRGRRGGGDGRRRAACAERP